VRPVVFHQVLDLLDAGGWQVRQQESRLHILVTKPGDGFDATATERAVQTALAKAGAQPPAVEVSLVESIPAAAAGKRPLIVAHAESRH
jgi:phenylacetate-CoA ligase